MKKRNTILFCLILILALFLRVYNLDKNPVSLFGDEIDVGYQAYSIIHTGHDLNGRLMPVYIKSLSEYRASLYIYSAIPFVAIFGLNEWGVRLPAVFWGMVSIFGIYLLTKKLFGKNTALLAAFTMSVSPWHLQYSRASFEVTMLLSFIIFGGYFFVMGLKKPVFLYLSTMLLGLTVYIYSTAVVFMPILLLILIVTYHRGLFSLRKQKMAMAIFVFFIAVAPAVWFVYKGEAKERFNGVSIFQQSILLDKINLAVKSQNFYNPDGDAKANNPTIERIFHNKLTVFAQVFFTNYMRSFSPDFLFSNGDINFRQSIHEMGELYYFEIILLSIGIWNLFYKQDLGKRFLLSAWILVAPIPSSLTADGGYHATRLILMLPPLIMLIGLGWDYLFLSFKKIQMKAILILVLVLFLFNFSFYLHRYYVHYPVESWRWWQIGYKQAMGYMKQNESSYAKLVFNDTYEPSLIRFLFWWQYPPLKFQSQYDPLKLDQKDILPGFTGNSIDGKYYFGRVTKDGGVISFVEPHMMYLVSARDEVPGDWDWSKTPPSGIKVLKTFRDPTGLPVFFVVTKQ